MQFPGDLSFGEAVRFARDRGVLPTGLGSAEIEGLSSWVRERSIFSARTTDAVYLQLQREIVGQIASGKLDFATARLRLQEYLDRTGYLAAEDEEGTLSDLRSDQRINLILETQIGFARGYGQYLQSHTPEAIVLFPAQELYRAESRIAPREWLEIIWPGAGGTVYAGGRMIAPKGDEIWTTISRFGVPYPPFDFNSGMDVREIGWEEAEELGVVPPGMIPDVPSPEDWTDAPSANAAAFDAELQAQLEATGFQIGSDGMLRLRGRGTDGGDR